MDIKNATARTLHMLLHYLMKNNETISGKQAINDELQGGCIFKVWWGC